MLSFSISNSNVLPENLWVSAEFLLLSTGPTLDSTSPDYVTNVDLLVQETLKERLRDLAPQVQFMGEEQDNSGLDWSRPCWILDPVDGTTNLIHRFPPQRHLPGLGGRRAVRVRRGV